MDTDHAVEEHLYMQVDTDQIVKAEGGTLLKVVLQLNAAEACFEPWLVGTLKPSVQELFKGWIQGCMDCAFLVTRLQSGTGKLASLAVYISSLV